VKPNRLQQVLAEGRVPVGHMVLEFGTRGVAKILEVAGADFVIFDMEHGPFDTAQIADLVAWTKATPVAPFVRIPQVAYHFVARALDAGALGIMVPNVRSADEARAVVDAAKYAPMGRRGVILGGGHGDFRNEEARAFFERSNRGTTIICQIESREGLEQLDAIASVPGVDILWVGQADLTQSLGIPGQFQDQRFLDALARVVEVARAHGLAAGIQPGSMAQAEEWMAIGYNVISYSGDYFVYRDALAQAFAGIRRLATDD
jgi:2-keto-3-deoxy-L-rhamnonate aldolase RhmA